MQVNVLMFARLALHTCSLFPRQGVGGGGSQQDLGVGKTEPALSRAQSEPLSPGRTLVLYCRDLSVVVIIWRKKILMPVWVSQKLEVWV